LNTTKANQIGQMIRQGNVILIAVLLARLDLGRDKIGNFEMLLYIGNIMSFFWLSAMLQQLLITGASKENGHGKKLIFNVFILFSLVSITLFLIFSLFSEQILPIIVGKKSLEGYQYFLLFLLFNFPSFILEALYLLEDKAQKLLSFFIISGILNLTAVILPLYLGYPFSYSFFGLIIFGLVRYLWCLIEVIRTKENKPDLQTIQKFTRLAMPLIGYSLLTGLAMNYDGFLINHHFAGDKSIFALFRYGARELPISLALGTALSASILVVLTKNKVNAQSLEQLKQESKRIWHIVFPLSAILLIFAKPLYQLVFKQEFTDAAPIFSIYLLIATSRMLFPQAILLSKQETKAIFYIVIIETISNIALSSLLIQYYGIIGVAYSTVAAYLLEKCLQAIYLHRKYQISPSAYMDLKLYFTYISLLIGIYYWFL
jgi:O-antigen/teichoic acid export membrane protein